MFFCNSLAFSITQWMLTNWSLVPLSFLNPSGTSGSSQFTYCWSLTWRILRHIWKEWIQWVQKACISPYTECYFFFLLDTQSLMFTSPVPFVASFYIPWLRLRGAVFSELLRCCLLGPESYTFPPNEMTLYFQVVTIFFNRQNFPGKNAE